MMILRWGLDIKKTSSQDDDDFDWKGRVEDLDIWKSPPAHFQPFHFKFCLVTHPSLLLSCDDDQD